MLQIVKNSVADYQFSAAHKSCMFGLKGCAQAWARHRGSPDHLADLRLWALAQLSHQPSQTITREIPTEEARGTRCSSKGLTVIMQMSDECWLLEPSSCDHHELHVDTDCMGLKVLVYSRYQVIIVCIHPDYHRKSITDKRDRNYVNQVIA